jgi:hypothetical protein
MANTGPGWIPAALVEEEDCHRLLNTKTAKQRAPRSAYQLFLVRKERQRWVKGFEEWRFRKKVIRWYGTLSFYASPELACTDGKISVLI